VAVLLAEVGDVCSSGLGDPQTEQPEHGDESERRLETADLLHPHGGVGHDEWRAVLFGQLSVSSK
jgi:hypothetical protein